MNANDAENRELREGRDYPSPVTRILALDYYDGPIGGVLQCGDEGLVYKFDVLFGPEQGAEAQRVFGLAPLPVTALRELAEAHARYQAPRWPLWVPMWRFPTTGDEEAMNHLTDRVLSQAGPVRWVVASSNLMEEIRAARAVSPEELEHTADWLAFLGVGDEFARPER